MRPTQGQKLNLFKVLICGGVPPDGYRGDGDAPTIPRSGQSPIPQPTGKKFPIRESLTLVKWLESSLLDMCCTNFEFGDIKSYMSIHSRRFKD